jgi:hypothetical protein
VVTGGRAGPPRRLLRGTEQLQVLIGKQLLVGITLRDRDGVVLERRQFFGAVTEVVDGVVVLMHAGGETLLPADPVAYEPARPGLYRLPSGVEVENPDYLSVWDVAPGDPSDQAG